MNDPDFRRNLRILQDENLCIRIVRVLEGGFDWKFQIITNTKKPNGPLWAVPHDNEHAAFDSAAYAVQRYGGTIVAIEADEQRFFRGQDPNRNFGNGTRTCPQQRRPAPQFTEMFMRHRSAGYPIIALHTNAPGSGGGNGSISIRTPGPGNIPFYGAISRSRFLSEDTLVFIAGVEDYRENPWAKRTVEALTGQGIHVIYETVNEGSNDCSMSNYIALNTDERYFNIEVVHSDSARQREIVDVVMRYVSGASLPPSRPDEMDARGPSIPKPSVSVEPAAGPGPASRLPPPPTSEP